MKRSIIIILLCLLFFISCQEKKEYSFYYWKTTYQLTEEEKKVLDKLAIKKLYVRFFDVDKKNDITFPVATIKIKEQNKNQEIIPVVFITNETFKNAKQAKIQQLAKHVYHEIKYLYPAISTKNIREIQIDCDWTTQTRENYFYFLNTIQELDKTITFSATIRLHQIKDKHKTGIPPIKKGVLMYYSTSSPLENSETNSILDNTIAHNYIQNLDQYPITLDVALPIYSWAIVSNELGDKKLVHGILNKDLADTTMYKKINENNYLVKKEYYLNAIFVYENYGIKIEYLSNDDIKKASDNISKKMKHKKYSTIFYHLDENNIKNYTIKNLKNY